MKALKQECQAFGLLSNLALTGLQCASQWNFILKLNDMFLTCTSWHCKG